MVEAAAAAVAPIKNAPKAQAVCGFPAPTPQKQHESIKRDQIQRSSERERERERKRKRCMHVCVHVLIYVYTEPHACDCV